MSTNDDKIIRDDADSVTTEPKTVGVIKRIISNKNRISKPTNERKKRIQYLKSQKKKNEDKFLLYCDKADEIHNNLTTLPPGLQLDAWQEAKQANSDYLKTLRIKIENINAMLEPLMKMEAEVARVKVVLKH